MRILGQNRFFRAPSSQMLTDLDEIWHGSVAPRNTLGVWVAHGQTKTTIDRKRLLRHGRLELIPWFQLLWITNRKS